MLLTRRTMNLKAHQAPLATGGKQNRLEQVGNPNAIVIDLDTEVHVWQQSLLPLLVSCSHVLVTSQRNLFASCPRWSSC